MKETDLRYVKTERAIRDAFFELLEESDFDKVSVTDITQRAQINRNTFYLHYSDKFNLVNSILIDFVQELSQQALKVIDQAEKPDTATFNQYFLTIFVSANRIKKKYRIFGYCCHYGCDCGSYRQKQIFGFSQSALLREQELFGFWLFRCAQRLLQQ